MAANKVTAVRTRAGAYSTASELGSRLSKTQRLFFRRLCYRTITSCASCLDLMSTPSLSRSKVQTRSSGSSPIAATTCEGSSKPSRLCRRWQSLSRPERRSGSRRPVADAVLPLKLPVSDHATPTIPVRSRSSSRSPIRSRQRHASRHWTAPVGDERFEARAFPVRRTSPWPVADHRPSATSHRENGQLSCETCPST